MTSDLSQVKAIVFDVFGTVVDWRSSILQEITAVAGRLGVQGNWEDFSDRWRAGYYEGTKDVLSQKRTWIKADTMHLERLHLLMDEYGMTGLSEEEIVHLNKAWHRLTPWPDSVEGLTRLKKKFIIGTLSNGNNGLLVHMAKHAGLPWDIVMGGENFQSYKPDSKVYIGAVDLLGYQPHEVMVAASHLSDLYAAKSNGLKTGFVVRPDEFGNSEMQADLVGDERIDVSAKDFVDLARKMGA
jgi:2-haloacid dehalogenase